MKKFVLIIVSLMVVFNFSNCGSKDSPTPPEEENVSYDVLFYEPDFSSRETKSDQLQATIKKSDLQFSTFGDVSSETTLGSFNKAYIYNAVENTESFFLFDEVGEPAFLYKINLVTGEKEESVVEFERIDQNSFYVRMFYYDWQNRLGTLLFETMITGSTGNYQSTPTFTIEDLNFNGRSSVNTTEKSNTSFPVKLRRLDQLMLPIADQMQSRGTNDGMMDWMDSFNQMKNSTIGDWLSTTRKAGAALTLAGLGLSETVVGAPVGVWLLAGGSTLIVGSTAIEVVVTDKWTNFLNETQSKMESLTEAATEIAGNMVQKFNGYTHDLKDHWVNSNITKTSLNEVTDDIESEDIIISKDDLDDLPDKNGVLQIGLSWDTEDTDVDLWVTDPSGEKVYYGNHISASGGYLDRDDTDGYGPENIYWIENIPDGDYLVQVHYFSGSVVSNYVVKVTNGLGYSATYNGTLLNDDQVDDVVTIHKSGININK